MAVSQQGPLPVDLAGIVAFQMLTQLMTLLASKGLISNSERVKIFNDGAAALSPPNDPRVQAIQQFLQQLAASIQGP